MLVAYVLFHAMAKALYLKDRANRKWRRTKLIDWKPDTTAASIMETIGEDIDISRPFVSIIFSGKENAVDKRRLEGKQTKKGAGALPGSFALIFFTRAHFCFFVLHLGQLRYILHYNSNVLTQKKGRQLIFRTDDARPIYVQIAEWLETEILNGHFQSGDKVYSQYQLAEMYNINPATAAKGLNLLAEKIYCTKGGDWECLLRKMPGKGL